MHLPEGSKGKEQANKEIFRSQSAILLPSLVTIGDEGILAHFVSPAKREKGHLDKRLWPAISKFAPLCLFRVGLDSHSNFVAQALLPVPFEIEKDAGRVAHPFRVFCGRMG
jgi:hypothetical protein